MKIYVTEQCVRDHHTSGYMTVIDKVFLSEDNRNEYFDNLQCKDNYEKTEYNVEDNKVIIVSRLDNLYYPIEKGFVSESKASDYLELTSIGDLDTRFATVVEIE